MANLLVAGNSSNGGTAITTDTSGTLNIVTGSGSGATAIAVDTSQSTTFNSAASTAPFIAKINGTEAARIDSSGNLLVGKTAVSQTTVGFQVNATTGSASFGAVNSCIASASNSTSTYEVYSTGAGAYRFYVGMAGTLFATSTTISGISDQRLKENVRDLDDGLEKVLALKPRKFDWKEGKGKNIKDDRGFIAQEYETVFPDMIEEWKDAPPEGEDPYKAVNANLIPTLVKAIQEQQAMIEELKAELDAVKAKVGA
jgi:hypothetical protein